MISLYDPNVLQNYVCNKCSADGVKLWRTHVSDDLWCAKCVTRATGAGPFAEDGTTLLKDGRRTAVIPWGEESFLPAIPHYDGIDFWGYNCAPEECEYWWTELKLPLISVKLSGTPFASIRTLRGLDAYDDHGVFIAKLTPEGIRDLKASYRME